MTNKRIRLIADSGSTKTAWCLVNGQNVKLFQTRGINPFQLGQLEMTAVLTNELVGQLNEYAHEQADDILSDIVEIFFYGAGCTPEKAPMVATAIRQALNVEARIEVKSDLLGAARALCGNSPGIACILGTGSNSCYFDGNDIVENVSPLGFILGDEGSGAYIGKRLIGDCIKQQLPEEVCQLFWKETKLNPATILQKVYREQMPSRFLASISPFCARHRKIPAIHELLVDAFRQFFIRNVALYQCPELPVHFVGSIAWFYQDELTEAARLTGFNIGNIVQSPITALLLYHQS